MKISCNIVRDLLPLYAEDLASQDTRNLVDEHLCTCEDCKSILNTMKTPASIPVEASPDALNKVKKTIRRRRAVSVMAAVMTVITIASMVFTYMFTPFQLTMDQALDDFYIREDGAAVIDYSPAVVGRVMTGRGDNRYLNQYSTRYDMWKGENRESIEALFGADGIITEDERLRYEGIEVYTGMWHSPANKVLSDAPIPWAEDAVLETAAGEWNWWYEDPTGRGEDILLHDAGKMSPEAQKTFSPVYPALCFGGMGMCLVLLVLSRLLKKPSVKEVAARLAILGGSLAAATLLVSSGNVFTTTAGTIAQYWGWMISMNTVLMTMTGLLLRQLHQMGKMENTK